MDQDQASSKSVLEAVKHMSPVKKTFLGCATLSPLSRALVNGVPAINESMAFLALTALLMLVGAAGLIGLVVVTLKEDSQRMSNGTNRDSLGILLVISACLAIFGGIFHTNLLILASIAVVAITVIRSMKVSENEYANLAPKNGKPTGLL